MKNYQNKKGFTLIELLVVVAIIAILAAVVISSLSTARTRARDTSRLQELKQIQVALELYYNMNGHYPYSNGPSSTNTWINECDDPAHFLIPELISGNYISKINDSISCSIDHWGYEYGSNGTDYKLLSHTEYSLPQLFPFIDPAQDWGSNNCILDGKGSDQNSGPGDWNRHFGVWSVGATCWVEEDPMP